MQKLLKVSFAALFVAATTATNLVACANPPAVPHNVALPMVAGQPLPSLAPMLEAVTPAVVNIATEGRIVMGRNPLLSDPFFRRFFDIPDQPRERRIQNLGSGVVVDAKQGYVITNHHVIKRADTITVTLRDGRQLQAKVIGSDPESDVAVIQIVAQNLTALSLADSSQLRVGDFVVAIGNPFGLGQTVTSGIVSALGRNTLGIHGYEDFIQTDASINPGNSGGALVNLRGELVGINTAIFAPSGGNVGIGFAIPSNMVKQLMEQLVQYGEVRRGQLGVSVQDLTLELAQAFGIQNDRGAVITQIMPNSAAQRAGIKAGDVVLAVNGKGVRNANQLRNVIGLLPVGEQVTLKILRDGETRTIKVRIGEVAVSTLSGEDANPLLSGAVFKDLDVAGSDKWQGMYGVYVETVAPRSPAHQAGLREDDIVIAVNRRPITDGQMLRQLARGQKVLLLKVQRGEGGLFLILR
jgi:serine protease Do/serine protease DegQ